MPRAAVAISLLFMAGTVQAQAVDACGSITPPQAPAVHATVLAPVAPEIVAPAHQLGAPSSVLAQAFDEAMSVDQVLYRIRLAGCANVASATPASIAASIPAPAPAASPLLSPGLPPGTVAPAPALPAATDPAAYQPRTEFDNAPWRFDMNQNGKSMTADEFTAWMEAKGVRVVKRPPPVALVVDTGAVVGVEAAVPAPASDTAADDDETGDE